MKNARNVTEPRNNCNTIGENFYICTSSDQQKFVRYYLELNNNLIFCKKGENEKAIAYMDIKNAFMKLTKLKMINGRPHFGIKFVKKSAYEEIYSLDRKVII